jgi:hypothetical protein
MKQKIGLSEKLFGKVSFGDHFLFEYINQFKRSKAFLF